MTQTVKQSRRQTRGQGIPFVVLSYLRQEVPAGTSFAGRTAVNLNAANLPDRIRKQPPLAEAESGTGGN